MRIAIIYSGLILVSAVFVSCRNDNQPDKRIVRAGELLYTSPDSANLLLKSISHPEALPKADYAAWCLHFTHSQYKCQKEPITDSLLLISINYYKKRNSPVELGTAYYLLGCSNRMKGNNNEAIAAFKEAEKNLSGTSAYRLKGLIEFNIGYLCMQDELYSFSLNYFKKSLDNFTKSKDDKYKAYTYREIASMYNSLDYPLDSILNNLNLALKLSYNAGDSLNYYTILSRKGVFLFDRDYIGEKNNLLSCYRYFKLLQPYYAAYLANIYTDLHQPDSANFYLLQALSDTTNAPYKIVSYKAAALVAKSKNDYVKAYFYLEKSYLFRDSTYQQNIRSQLYKIDKQFDLTQKEAENANLIIANRTKLIWIALLIIAVLTVIVILLLINAKYKKKNTLFEFEKQRLEFEVDATKFKNVQKQEMLLMRLNERIENTLKFSKLKNDFMSSERNVEFVKEITKQSVLSENEWTYYIDEANKLFDNKIEELKSNYKLLTKIDLIVIVLICFNVNINNSLILLNMTKNTLYVRRKTIKKRLGIVNDIDLEEWVKNNITQMDRRKFNKEM